MGSHVAQTQSSVPDYYSFLVHGTVDSLCGCMGQMVAMLSRTRRTEDTMILENKDVFKKYQRNHGHVGKT